MTGVKVEAVAELADHHRDARNLRRLKTVLSLVDPGAESPKETWLRLVLIRADFPRPTTQIPAVGPHSCRRYRIDMGWEDVMAAVEYDGEQHRLDEWRYRCEILRREELERLGWIIIRLVAGGRTPDIVRRVREARQARCSSLR